MTIIVSSSQYRKPRTRRNLIFLSLLAMVIFLFYPWTTTGVTEARETTSNSNLQKRLSNLESRWGHIQIGGDFNLSAEYFSSIYNKPQSLSLQENSHIFLDAQVDRNFSLYFLLTQESTFGATNIPIYLDEIALRYRSPHLLGDAGRFRFTLDPLGLIADHSTIPIEGLAFQTGGRSWYLGGYYTRQLSSYFLNDGVNFSFGPTGTNTLRADEEVAVRLAFPRPSYMTGVTFSYTNNGVSRISDQEARELDSNVVISPEKISTIAVDFATELQGGNLQGEAAWYPQFDQDGNRTGGSVGWLLVWAKPLPKAGFTAKAWSFPDGFSPFYSVIGASDSDGNMIIGNSRGLLGEYQKELAPEWNMRAQAGIIELNSKTPENNGSPDLIFSGRLTKSFSSLTSIEFGYDWGFQPVEDGEARYSRFVIGTTALF